MAIFLRVNLFILIKFALLEQLDTTPTLRRFATAATERQVLHRFTGIWRHLVEKYSCGLIYTNASALEYL